MRLGSLVACPNGAVSDVKWKNVTVSAESMSVLRKFRLSAFPTKDDIVVTDCNRLLRALRRTEESVNCPRPVLRGEVWRSCEGENEWLV